MTSVKSAAASMSAASMAAPSMAPIAPSAGKTRKVGVNPQFFNNLFSTNGFVISTAADDIDLIYYSAVNPVEDSSVKSTARAAASSTIYYRSIVSKQPPINCTDGYKVSILQKIDYLQTKNVMNCIRCRPGTYFNRLRKDCSPLPIYNPTL